MAKKFQMVGASVITYKKDKVLLQRRKDNGCWGYHGGAVELGENVELAARRELLEETGLTAGKLQQYGVFSGPEIYNKYPDGNEAYIIDIVFLCTDFSGEITMQQEEVSDMRWFDIHDIPENLSPPIKPILEKFCRDRIEFLNVKKKIKNIEGNREEAIQDIYWMLQREGYDISELNRLLEESLEGRRL